ncbi:MAG: transposon-encoded TnpW family protein [Defluviitaleaceae bacterium]|nr:transposon-encoded TnpW family protein [Defluviitaleaceae bacterium]
MKHTLEASAARTQGKPHAEPINMQKRIGSTTFKVSVHFSTTSQETVEDKVLRLIKREVSNIA